jgi:hydrogenase nickel incorporation protein HypA/HybF
LLKGKIVHELSIAMSIVEMAQEESDRRGGVQVNSVHLKLGALSGVVEDALLSSFEIASADTPLQGSRLLIETVPVSVYCPNCRSPQRLNSIQSFSCPECGTLTPEVLSGRELEVVALEITQ